MSKDRKDKEMICGLTADERHLLQQELNDLPDVMPPRAVWERIREQAEAEGLIGQSAMRRPMSWRGGLGLAAAAGFLPRQTSRDAAAGRDCRASRVCARYACPHRCAITT